MRRKLAALIALTTTACTSWQVQRAPTPSVVQSAGDKSIRVELTSGVRVDIYQPRLEGDSIVGMSGPVSQKERMHVAVATSEVLRITQKKVNTVRTVLAVTAITIAALAIIGAATAPSPSPSSNSSCASTSA